MSKKGYSRPGLFGTMKHYDADGNFIGESRPQGIFNILTVHLFWKKEWFSQDSDLPADHVCSYF